MSSDSELERHRKSVADDLKIHREDVARDLVDWRDRIDQTIRDLSTEMRERLRTADEERKNQYNFQKTEFREIRESIEELKMLARETNGQVQRHKEEIYGTPNEDGMKKSVRSLLDSRLYITILAGFIVSLILIVWTVYGPEIKSRGFLNRTDAEELQLIDQEIWKHNHQKNEQNP